jgi:hypothetical protein
MEAHSRATKKMPFSQRLNGIGACARQEACGAISA